MKNDRISISIGDTVFLTGEENHIAHNMNAVVGKVRKGYYVKKKKSFSNKKHETKTRTALTRYLAQIAKK